MENKNYYEEQLNSQMLFQVYDTKLPRTQQYLTEEINRVKKDLAGDEDLLEIGCGYGRILRELANSAKKLTGIDISANSIKFAEDYLKDFDNIELIAADFNTVEDGEIYDVVILLQNGLSAVKGDPSETVNKCLGLLKKGGRAYFSAYSANFWDERLKWFEEQSDKKLLGKIDYEKTKDGVIVCEDGFKAITFSEEQLRKLGDETGQNYMIEEVDGSSLFLIIDKQ
ncbi:putative methyltransferase type 12 [Peptoniphilus sp. ING2-D1G]|nr:putative methyltransferase type 12 [Peptoniphilus sp. ING2-D1G]